MKSGLILFALIVVPRFSDAELFLDVTIGDTCDAAYEMEVARGAEPALAREEMIRRDMLGFQRADAQMRETSLYRCHDGAVTSVSHAVAFDTETAQQRYFREQRHALEERFGVPELDTFNLSLWEKILLCFERMNEMVASFKTVYWALEKGESARLYLSERPNQDRKYVVFVDIDMESAASPRPTPMAEQAPD